jgi:hypothetical protein
MFIQSNIVIQNTSKVRCENDLHSYCNVKQIFILESVTQEIYGNSEVGSRR